jgi:broad specificity phosphatase PhoE
LYNLDTMTRLCFVRHGQTDWNLEGRWQGHADVHLNSTGLTQAAQARDALAGQHFDAIYSSDLQRASVTASVIAQKQFLPVVMDPRLRELNMGEWEGKLVSDIPNLYPDAWSERLENPLGARPPGGESVLDLSQRIIPAVTAICAKHQPDDRLMIVSHGLSLAVLICYVNGWPLGEAFKNIPPNATPLFKDWVLAQ